MEDHFIKRVYKYHDKVKLHVKQTTEAYKSLHPKADKFSFSDGIVKDLLSISGTIPVVYRQSTYNIPVTLWLLDTYPAHPPICYVTPAGNMKISVSMTVDHVGKVYLPYLHDWNPNSSDLHTLVQFLILSFGERMPVFQVAPTAAAANPNTPYPVNPSPYNMPPSPMTTPYPTYSQPPSMTPYPPLPANRSPGYPIHGAGPMPWDMLPPSMVTAGLKPWEAPSSGYEPGMTSGPPDPKQWEMLPPSGFQNMGSWNTAHPPYPSFSQQPPQATGTITEEHIRASLLSAVEDKVRQNMKEHVAQWVAEFETLQKIQSELTHGKERINHLMTALEREQSEWEKVLTTLRDKDLELDAALLNISNQGELDVDEAVVTTAPLYKQLLTAFAEEAATEDAIYYLGEALRRGVIDLDIFLKHVRSLSRKQFMLRALMNKCRNKAGLC